MTKNKTTVFVLGALLCGAFSPGDVMASLNGLKRLGRESPSLTSVVRKLFLNDVAIAESKPFSVTNFKITTEPNPPTIVLKTSFFLENNENKRELLPQTPLVSKGIMAQVLEEKLCAIVPGALPLPENDKFKPENNWVRAESPIIEWLDDKGDAPRGEWGWHKKYSDYLRTSKEFLLQNFWLPVYRSVKQST